MDAKQRRRRRRNENRKLKKENAELIEKYTSDGTSYSIQDGKVEKVEVEVLDTPPPSRKRVPIIIDDDSFKEHSAEPFNVSNEMFKDLVQKWVSIIDLIAPKKENENGY